MSSILLHIFFAVVLLLVLMSSFLVQYGVVDAGKTAILFHRKKIRVLNIPRNFFTHIESSKSRRGKKVKNFFLILMV